MAGLEDEAVLMSGQAVLTRGIIRDANNSTVENTLKTTYGRWMVV